MERNLACPLWWGIHFLRANKRGRKESIMANPQTENGYTKIANEILEALAGIRIPGEARQCLDVIIRKTYGYGKKEDHISLSQFSAITHMGKDHICRNLNKLKEMQIIIAQKGNEKGNLYRFNKDFHAWTPLPKKAIVAQKGKASLPKKAKVALPKTANTIDNKDTKENTTKEIDIKHSPVIDTILKQEKDQNLKNAVKEALHFYGECFKEKTGLTYHCVFPKDTPIMKSLLSSTPLPELKELIRRFFQSTDSFIIEAGFTIGVLSSQINKLKSSISAKPKEKQYGFK